MKKKSNINAAGLLAILLLTIELCTAQDKKNTEKRLPISRADSLINEFRSSVYSSMYNPAFFSKHDKPIFAVLKIDINENGKVTTIKFSDSADTSMVNAFNHRPIYHDYNATLEKYAKENSYKNVAILITVSYEPHYDIGDVINYYKFESLMRFDKKDFSGNAIILAPIRIPILSKNNM